MPSLPKRLRGAAAQPPSSAAPGSTPRPAVKRLNNKPLIIGGGALAVVILAVAFFVTSKPPAADPAAPGSPSAAGAPTPGTAEFLNTDPEPNDTIPGPKCQGLDCAAVVAAGQAGAAAPAGAPPAGLVVDPATGALVDPATGTVYRAQVGAAPAGPASYPVGDPYAVSYGPEPQATAPAAAPAAQECDRSCRYRQARAARLGGADGGSTASAGAAAPAPVPGPDGLMPESYYAAQADSVMGAEIARLTGGDSGPNQRTARPAVQQPQQPAQAAPSAPSSPYVVPAGTLIPAALVTGINSDICGDVKAVVTRDVFDARQRLLVIPAGTELLGNCGNSVSAGQARLAVAWTRLRLPDGRNVSLPGLPTHSPSGESGVRDRVNNHWGRVFGTAVLLSAIGAGVQLSIPQETDGATLSPAQTAATAAAAQLADLATEILRRGLEVKPTIDIRPATPFTVFVAADLDVGAPVRRRGGR